MDLLTGVEDFEWQKPSPCPEWSLLGLCAHLVGGDFGLLSRHPDGYHGTPSPEGLTESDSINWLDDLQAEWGASCETNEP